MLLVRKMLVAGLAGALAYFVVAVLPFLDAVEKQDWDGGWSILKALAVGLAVAFGRALVASLTAFVPSDAEHGVNLLGKYSSTG